MAKTKDIRNITDLRNHALETLRDLKEGGISIQQAATNAGIYSSVISTIKTQLDYYKAVDEKPAIPFMDVSPTYEIETSRLKQITHREDEDE